MIFIGIDPGLHTGWAEWDSKEKRFLAIKTIDFWKAVRILESTNSEKVGVVIEDPGQNRFAYTRNRSGVAPRDLKIQRNVGSNAREATLIIELCKELGIACTPVKPMNVKIVRRGEFALRTKWVHATSQHGRDAAMLVYGR